MTKNSILKSMLVPLALATVGNPCYSREKMNVLFISVDDMNNDLACFGNQLVKSPNLNRLASRGVAFSNSYCQYPLSSPSRSSMLTGLRPDVTKVFDLQYHFRQGLPDVVTLPQMFMKNGYYVARVGKAYHYGNPGDIGTNGLDDKVSWLERINPAGLDKTSLESDVINYTPTRKGLGSAMAYYADKKGTDVEHTDGKVADETIKLLKENKDKPFFIFAGFYKPHCPWIAPGKYFDYYNIDQMKLPPINPEIKNYYPELALASTKPWPILGLNTQQAKECKLAYYSAISFVDAQIGRLLEAVTSLGLSDNTIIVFWSDNGYQLGEHGLWFKQSLFEESAKVPLIISVPGTKSGGKVCRQPVEMLDIYPTLAELTGLTPPSNLQGYSLSSLLINPTAKWNHPAYTQVQRGSVPGHSVRTEKWRYTEWNYGENGVELYDEINDKQELQNLAADQKYLLTVKEMKELLHKNHPNPVAGGQAVANTRETYCN